MNQLETIYVVFKTHVDLGFTDLPSQVTKQYTQDMAHDVISICDKTAHFPVGHRFVWTVPSWVLDESLQQADEELRGKLEKLVEAGQLSWHGLPFTTQTEFCGLEEWIRGLYVAARLSERFGKKTRSAKMTDVPGHAWMLPSLLKGAGIDFLHLGVNACSLPVDVPRLFFWEGPDGKQVLTFYSKGEYGTSLLPPDDWHYPVWLALQQTHDNAGPQDETVITEILAKTRAAHPNAKVVVGTMDDFAADFLSRGFTDIPVVRKDLADTWIHGVGSYPNEVSLIREVRSETVSKEMMAAFQKLETGESPFAADIEEAYKEALLFGEHTWGHDVKILLLPGRNSMRAFEDEDVRKDRERFPETYDKLERSWEEKRAYAYRAAEAAKRIVPLQSTDAGEGRPNKISIFNSLPWTRTDEIVHVGSNVQGCLVDETTEERLPIGSDGTVRIPEAGPLGYRTYRLEELKAGEEAAEPSVKSVASMNDDFAILENRYLLIRVDRTTGSIVQLTDKRTGREWASADQPFGVYEYDVYGKNEINQFVKDYAFDLMDWYVNDFSKPGYPRIDHHLYRTKLEKLDIVHSGSSAELRLTLSTPDESRQRFGNAEQVTMSISLGDDDPYFDMTVNVLNKKATAFADAGFVQFYPKTAHPEYRYQKLGAIIDPLKDIARNANQRLHCFDSWIDIRDGNEGLAILAKDNPLLSLGEKGVFACSPLYTPEQSAVYMNLFNNQWGTNYPQWIEGNMTFRYRIAPHQGNWQEGEVWKLAEQWRSPLIATSSFDGIEASRSLFRNDLNGIQVLAWKTAATGDGYVLRLQNALDAVAEQTVAFQLRLESAAKCDLLENEQDSLAILDDAITLSFAPREIITIKIRTS
ncbi:DUF5054 domain-containing protein [Cohnella soli]|uniref:DUF5054 domain-containing protein n=1 Tax=Cohnella soli TaxID=425005 RepID=A0ABW0HSI1_9BACL